ncbi:hypothetical protein [Anoxybacteroides tepidamans]|uniref:hypothetical protein n=1 Tax=Anoxybacteroides tepidamans TaxID=265948 RepID=UPI000487FBDB|nr:hypothetical protein [Anoxybacillus tepidamans]
MNSFENSSVQETMERIWRNTCGTWENCNVSNVQSFLSECFEHNIDPQYCMDWITQHTNEIPNASAILDEAQEWVNEHTSTGSPLSGRGQATNEA